MWDTRFCFKYLWQTKTKKRDFTLKACELHGIRNFWDPLDTNDAQNHLSERDVAAGQSHVSLPPQPIARARCHLGSLLFFMAYGGMFLQRHQDIVETEWRGRSPQVTSLTCSAAATSLTVSLNSGCQSLWSHSVWRLCRYTSTRCLQGGKTKFSQFGLKLFFFLLLMVFNFHEKNVHDLKPTGFENIQ